MFSLKTSISSLFVLVLVSIVLKANGQNEEWRTKINEPNRCAMHGLCGSNTAGDVLCPNNIPAPELDDILAAKLVKYCPYLWNQISSNGHACCSSDQLESVYQSMSRAFLLISGCEACLNNFVNLWCTTACHPDQSMFVDVIDAEIDPDTNQTYVKEANFFLSDDFKETFFNSCAEVKFGAAGMRFFFFVGNPQTPDELLVSMGTSYEDKGTSPYQLTFPPEEQTPASMTAYDEEIPTCASRGYECSCADCSHASYCKPIVIREDEGKGSKGPLRYYEYAILAGGVVGLCFLWWLVFLSSCSRTMFEIASGEASSDYSYEPQSDGNELTAVLIEGDTLKYPFLERLLRATFRCLGRSIARRPLWTIFASLAIVAGLSVGNMYYALEKSPQGLWTPAQSRSALNKERYDASFGEFYRVENLILATTPNTPSSTKSTSGLPAIVNYANLNLAFKIHDIIENIEVTVEDEDTSNVVHLDDVCYKTMGHCVAMNILQYWKLDAESWDATVHQKSRFRTVDNSTHDEADHCFQNWPTDCFSTFGAPIDPKSVLGGFPTDDTFQSYVDDSTAFAMTYLLDSRPEKRKAALAWEEAFISKCQTEIQSLAEENSLQITFMAERSTQDEIERETYMDSKTIAISYAVMFLYITLSLTFLKKRHRKQNLFVQSHFVIGFIGVGVVVLSIVGAFGILSYMGMKVSLMVLEVLPFLVLAIGVDNMFILANEFSNMDPTLPLIDRFETTLTEVGPSIMCAALGEVVAFGLAVIPPVPATRNFSLCACFAILLDFILQCTLFGAFLVLDTKRRESNRVDCIPCLQLQQPPSEDPQYVVSETGTPPHETREEPKDNFLQWLISKFYVPLILNQKQSWFRFLILALTLVLFTFSGIGLGRMKLGMEEQIALPADSYLQQYFSDGMPLMRIGAPVFFVVEDLNVSNDSEDIKKVCATTGCRPDSLVSQIDLAAEAGAHYLASPAASWVDDFQLWLMNSKCCRTYELSTDFCPINMTDPNCIPCSLSIQFADNVYQTYLPGFMISAPDASCARGGEGVYGDAIEHIKGNVSEIVGLDQERIAASAFRTMYRALVTQEDYIGAVRETFAFVDALKASLGLDVYSYSIFHIYFQQYMNIVDIAAAIIGIAVVAVFLVCWILLSSFRTALIVIICVILTIVDLIGVSHFLGVRLNGVSVVNLIMSVGIAVEFCVHLAHGFVILPGTRSQRAATAFRGIGVSVISGIAITKFVGVVVLAFATTPIFKIYYFRMYMSLVVFGAWHGLVVLPILLGLVGSPPPVTQSSKADSERIQERLDSK